MKSPRFGIGINDKRVPSGVLGKTSFAVKFENSIRSPLLELPFNVLQKCLLNDSVLNLITNPKFRPLMHFLRTRFESVGQSIDKKLLSTPEDLKLFLFGSTGKSKHRSALGGMISHLLQKYIQDWRARQDIGRPVPPPIRDPTPPPKNYRGWQSLREQFQPQWKIYPPEGEFIKILPSDTMTPKERITRLIQGKNPDRVGFGPCWNYAVSYMGGSNIWEYCYDGIASGLAGINTFLRIGGTDFLPISYGVGAYATPFPDTHSRFFFNWSLPNDAKFPQFIEEPLLKVYADLYSYGFTQQTQEITKRLIQDTLVMLREAVYLSLTAGRYFGPIKDQFLSYSDGMVAPLDFLPMMRGLVPFSRDCIRNKQDIVDAFMFMTKPMTDLMIRVTKLIKGKTVLVGCSRGSNTWMSPKQFEETHWPSLKYILNALLKADLIPMCHFDNNWTDNMPFLAAHLPKRSCVFHLDQVDLVKVREKIGDHFCLMGGLSPGEISLSTPAQLEDKLKYYIKGAGADGLILASGCEFPIDVPIENVYTYKRAIQKYGLFH